MNGKEEAACGPLHIFQERKRGVGTHYDPVINSSCASLDGVIKHLKGAENRHATAVRAAGRLKLSVEHVTAKWGEEWIQGNTTTNITVDTTTMSCLFCELCTCVSRSGCSSVRSSVNTSGVKNEWC